MTAPGGDSRPRIPVLPDDVPDGSPHVYLSTACLHGEHGYCQAVTGHCGAKVPAQCKFCAAPCVCDCHAHDAGPPS